MATLQELQKQLDEKSIDPSKLSKQQRDIIDTLIDRGELKGPKMGELGLKREIAANEIARQEEFYKDPIGQALQAEDSMFKGRPTAELAGDLSGSIAPYVTMRKKIFGAAKNGALWQKGPGKFLQAASKVADRLPGRLKLLGGALKLVARTADVPAKVWSSPLGKAEIYSVLGGTAGAAAGSITYDTLNEQAGITIATAITDQFRDVPEKEIDQDILANSFRATKNAAMWNAGAAALTPFIMGPLGKLTGKLFGGKSEKAVRLSEFAKEKGLPLPLMTGIEDGVFSELGRNYFKTVGVFPFVSGIGRESLQVAEQEAGKQFLDGLVRYAPLMKTAALSSSIYNQAAKTFAENAAVIGTKYQAFENFAKEMGNPRVISLDKASKYARELVESNREMFPNIPSYTQGLGDIDIKNIDKLLKDGGDPLNLYMQAIAAIGKDKITPLEYSGVMRMLNRAIESSNLKLSTGSVWTLREMLENDLNAFGQKLTKDNFLQDTSIKAGYDAMVKQSGKEFADADIAYKIKTGMDISNKLKDANATFSAVMGFTKHPLIKSFRKFDSTLFTQRGVNGIRGIESMSRDKMFQTMERDVFASNSPEAIEQFKVIIGAAGKNATKNGKALFDASKARYMFNAFLKSFETAGSPQAKSIFNDVAAEASVKSGNKYFSDALEDIGADTLERARGFSIDDVRLNNGIYDVSKIRFGPKDFAEFNINKFMDNLGIGKAIEDNGREKMLKMLGKGGTNDFYKFTDYMKAISDISVSDTSTFLQRRFTLSGGRGVLSGLVIGGGMAAANPLAPAIFLLLARKAGRMLTDPVALRLMNDALGVDDQLKILKGQKIRGKVYSSGKIRRVTPKLTALGLTQKREAFARLMNYFADEDGDIPRVDPKTVDPVAIQNMLLEMPFENTKPRFDDNTIPKESTESMFAQDFTPGSGNVEIDNQMVDYIQSTAKSNDETELDDAQRNEAAESEGSMMDDFELQDPTQQTPATGQVDPAKFAAVFPDDNLGQAIANRGVKRG